MKAEEKTSTAPVGGTAQSAAAIPSGSDLEKVQKIIENDRALFKHAGAPTCQIELKSGRTVMYSTMAKQVAQALIDAGQKPLTASNSTILGTALRLIQDGLTSNPPDADPAASTPEVSHHDVVQKSGPESGDVKAPDGDGGAVESCTSPTASPATSAPTSTTGARTHQIEIKFGETKGVYAVHPVASMFPLVQGRAYEELLKSLEHDGQQEPCVVDGKTFLDGRNRVNGLNELGRATRVAQFGNLKTGLTPAAWVMTRNLQRRHLTNDQYLAIVAKYRAWCKEEATRQQAGAEDSAELGQGVSSNHADAENTEAGQHQDSGESSASDFQQKSADNVGKRKRGRPPGDRSEAKALAKATDQTRYRAEQMLEIRQHSPELATAVEEGRMSVKEAMRHVEAQKKTVPLSEHRKDKGTNAVTKAKQALSKLAGKLDADEQAAFWQQVAAFAVEKAEHWEQRTYQPKPGAETK